GADAGGSNPGNDTADEQPRQVRSQRHQDVVQPKPEIGYENHAAATEAIRQRTENRRADELHQRPYGGEHAINRRAARGIAAGEVDHDLRQYGNDQPQRQHVERDGDQNEDQRRSAQGCGHGVPGWSSRATSASIQFFIASVSSRPSRSWVSIGAPITTSMVPGNLI